MTFATAKTVRLSSAKLLHFDRTVLAATAVLLVR